MHFACTPTHPPTHPPTPTHGGPATCTLVYVYRLESHIVDIEVDGPGATTESRFTVCVRRDNPAQMGVVTGQATYASFYSSLTGMVECIRTCTHKFSTCTITSCTIAWGNNHCTHNSHPQHTVLQAHFNMHTCKRTCHTQTVHFFCVLVLVVYQNWAPPCLPGAHGRGKGVHLC